MSIRIRNLTPPAACLVALIFTSASCADDMSTDSVASEAPAASLTPTASSSPTKVTDDVTAVPPKKALTLFERFFAALDDEHGTWSTNLESYARHTDAFFGDARAFEDSNDTNGQMSVGIFPKEAEGERFDFRLRVKIHLPRTQKRFRLLIESDPKELVAAPTLAPTPAVAAKEASYGLALETQLEDTGAWVLSPAAGIKVSSWPPDPYFRLRAVRYESLDPWLVRFSAGASNYVAKGPLASVQLDFDRTWINNMLFRVTGNIKWKKDRENNRQEMTGALGSLTLFHDFSPRSKLSYSVGVQGDDDPTWWVDSFSINVAYRHALHKRWFFGTVNPELTYPRDRGFTPTWGVMLRLEAYVGKL